MLQGWEYPSTNKKGTFYIDTICLTVNQICTNTINCKNITTNIF